MASGDKPEQKPLGSAPPRPALPVPPWEAELASQALAEDHAREARLAEEEQQERRAEHARILAEAEAEAAENRRELEEWNRRPGVVTPGEMSRTLEEVLVPRRIRRSYWYAVVALLVSGLIWWLWNPLFERLVRWLMQQAQP